MIKLKKLDKPHILVNKQAKWTEKLMGYVVKGEKPPEALIANYRHTDIKKQVELETTGKCMYCESSVSHISYGDVEHIIPKSFDPAKTFEWENLSYACTKCNNNKNDYYDPDESLLNPYVDDPQEFLVAFGVIYRTKQGKRRGEITWQKLELNRGKLVEMREEALDDLSKDIARYCNESSEFLKEIYAVDIKAHFAKGKEYIFFKRQYLICQGLGHLLDLDS